MKALQATCIVGAITFTGMILQVGGNTPGATVPYAMPEAAASAETPSAPALSQENIATFAARFEAAAVATTFEPRAECRVARLTFTSRGSQ
jgi:hypothetical protein